MALAAGVLSLTLEYAKGLADRDLFFRQDPYCIIRVGGQTRRSKTARNGGTNPVFNETFQLSLINENNVQIEIKDECLFDDSYIGSCTFSPSTARQTGSDHPNVPVISKRSGKQHGFLSVGLKWTPSNSPAPGASTPPPPPQQQPCSSGALPATTFLPPQPTQPLPLPQYGTAPMYGNTGPVPMLPSPAPGAAYYPQQPQQLPYTGVYGSGAPQMLPYLRQQQQGPNVYVVSVSDDEPYYHHRHHHHRHHHHHGGEIVMIREVF